VRPGRAIDLRLVAETIDVDVETLRAINPSLLRLATPDDPGFELHLPVGSAERFSAEIADIPADKWVSWRRHRVEAGETLTSIAKKYHVTPVAIAEANSLEHGTALDAGEKLIIPAAAMETEAKRHLVSYRVRKGDTFLGIADRYNVEADDLKKWNRLKANKVNRGMVLRIYTVGGSETGTARSQANSKASKKPRTSTKVAQASPSVKSKNE
jgi:membrane-bound lytic murein transglycosylase D